MLHISPTYSAINVPLMKASKLTIEIGCFIIALRPEVSSRVRKFETLIIEEWCLATFNFSLSQPYGAIDRFFVLLS